jgi:hypothetical protein
MSASQKIAPRLQSLVNRMIITLGGIFKSWCQRNEALRQLPFLAGRSANEGRSPFHSPFPQGAVFECEGLMTQGPDFRGVLPLHRAQGWATFSVSSSMIGEKFL